MKTKTIIFTSLLVFMASLGFSQGKFKAAQITEKTYIMDVKSPDGRIMSILEFRLNKDAYGGTGYLILYDFTSGEEPNQEQLNWRFINDVLVFYSIDGNYQQGRPIILHLLSQDSQGTVDCTGAFGDEIKVALRVKN